MFFLKGFICAAIMTAQCIVSVGAEQLHTGIAVPSTDGRVSQDEFHVDASHTPDHIIGQGGPPVMDVTEERKTARYTDVDAVNGAMNAVVMPMANDALHGAGAKAWMRRTAVALSFQKHWKPLYAVETLQPVGHFDDRSNHVWFIQHRMANTADVGTTVNFGAGYRKLSAGDRRYYGANVFYDHRFKRHHGRFSAGLEYMSGESEFRANWYRGISGDKMFDGGAHTFEHVSDGYTVEYGRTFQNARWARVYMEVYHWDQQHQADKTGLRLGTELQLTPRLSVDVGYNKPEHSGGGEYGKIMFRLAGADTAWFGGKHRADEETTVRSKMLENVRRHNHVRVE